MNGMELIMAIEWDIIRGNGRIYAKGGYNLLHPCIVAGSGADVDGGHIHGYILFRIER
jgi:hypothetical protein